MADSEPRQRQHLDLLDIGEEQLAIDRAAIDAWRVRPSQRSAPMNVEVFQ
jgi:hypothetical protein